MERDEGESLPEAAARKEVRRERLRDVEIHRRRPSRDEIQRAVDVGHEHAPRSVGNLAEIVDPRGSDQTRIGRLRNRRRLRKHGERLDLQRQAGRDWRFGYGIEDGGRGLHGQQDAGREERERPRQHQRIF